MRRLLTLAFAVLALLVNACERHPLPGDPHPAEKHGAGHGEAHAAAGEHGKAAAHGEAAGAGKGEEAPKFFPEKH